MGKGKVNYTKLFSRGSAYVYQAVFSWRVRKEKLISLWLQAETDYQKKTPQKERISYLIVILEDRINTLIKIRHSVVEKIKQEQLEAENTLIMLYCPRFECRYDPNGVTTGVRFKDYIHDSHACEKCGALLQPAGDMETDQMLFELGINL